MKKVMKCRLCGKKYMVYAMEVRDDPSVCRQCEAEAKANDRNRWIDISKPTYYVFKGKVPIQRL